MTAPLVVLIGAPGAGKTVVAKALARELGIGWRDSDHIIVDRAGPVEEIFAQRGEAGFRELEAQVVAELLTSYRGIVSLGGGAVLHPGTRELLRAANVVYLDVDLETVLPRIEKPDTRPLLAGDPAARWLEIVERRRPLYEELATLTVKTAGLGLKEILHAISTHRPFGFTPSGVRVDGSKAPSPANFTTTADEPPRLPTPRDIMRRRTAPNRSPEPARKDT